MEKPYCDESEEILGALKEGFLKSVTDDLKAIKIRKGTRTDNAKNAITWDLRYENIALSAEEVGLQPIWIPRGALWELVAVLNENLGYIYFFMNNRTPEQQVESLSHYLPNTMRVMNSDLNEEENSTVSLFGSDELNLKNEQKFSEEVCRDMLGEYYDKITRAFVIRRDSKTKQVSLLTMNGFLDFIHEEPIPDRELVKPLPSKNSNINTEESGKIGITIKKREKENKNS
ncbi:DUF5986 family protein [Lactococcus garvieae]